MADELVAPPSLALAEPTKVTVQGAFRRTRSPPRNDHGQMFCDHVNCRGKNSPTFKRVCEWNKHMDRHERPYKCRESGCELNPGFTYSGGLLRHQREVHKMHLSTKQPLFCPFPNCNRSSGTGFTRKENLEEHKRRRHLEELSDHEAEATEEPPAAKRRRISSTATAEVQGQGLQQQKQHQQQQQQLGSSMVPQAQAQTMDNNMVVGNPESQLVSHLREEIRQKEEFIRRQATEIHRLQNLLRSLPPQAIYHMQQQQQQSRMPGSGVG
ncbi:hypothetical protein A1O7_09977 [Cladophialophora yegresii CBS 114405]|uniref:C2H2-type domain-containing protein n=1 Tax=Cladophialophora yegresii CBS 114405 TaxID=1182544 RepID=W9VR44_9EURO|nr:uncharacterized protein A1O7_09977 [Cladophialophora yegresii CBS 114405]EXJ54636.1 hypothetical protein A1O7_09977 [Cladophialophora yegresii CBS 114405]